MRNTKQINKMTPILSIASTNQLNIILKGTNCFTLLPFAKLIKCLFFTFLRALLSVSDCTFHA